MNTATTPYWLYGLHAVRAALGNPQRTVHRFVATQNAVNRLDLAPGAPSPEILDVRQVNRLLGEAVHQGVALLVDPLDGVALHDLRAARCVLLLDQITDPHNVGAIFRSAAAFAADAIVMPERHSAPESGALAKAASGALDLVPLVSVVNLTRAIETLKGYGLVVAALDSEAEHDLESLPAEAAIAFVLGAEGKGVRQGVRQACDRLVRIEAPGALASLNVSNAAAIALYAASRRAASAAP